MLREITREIFRQNVDGKKLIEIEKLKKKNKIQIYEVNAKRQIFGKRLISTIYRIR